MRKTVSWAQAFVILVALVVPALLPGCGQAMTPEEAYSSLLQHSEELTLMQDVENLLSWDEKTMMPPGGAESRERMNGMMAEMLSEKSSDPMIGTWLEAAGQKEDWGLVEQANLREWERDYERSKSVPAGFYKEQAELTARAFDKWMEAREKNDFSVLAPTLQELVDLDKREAGYYGYENTYDGLLDKYEPGLTTEKCDALFSSLHAELLPLIDRIVAAQGTRGARPVVFDGGPYPVEAQQAFNRMVSEGLCFDFQAGRVDPTAHPFCLGIARGDTRITTHYDTSDPTVSLGHQVHETGHGLYEQGLKADGTPSGMPCSWGVHESQSRFHEDMIGKGSAFWSCWYPEFASAYGLTATREDFLTYYNWVEPSLIRTEADEVTYGIHILIRYEIERDLFNGDLQVADVPAVWNQKYRDYLGVEVPDDNSGVLQDVHWSNNLFGYFPTYTLGDVYAAQLFDALKRDVPGVESSMAAGDYTQKHRWLSEHVYGWGKIYLPEELIEKATGSPVSTSFFIEYLKNKYEFRADLHTGPDPA